MRSPGTRITHRLVLLAVMSILCVVDAGAQGAAPRPVGPNTLSGVVRDESGRPIGEADVFVNKLQLRTRTREDGSFQFAQVKEGRYDVSARKIGYAARTVRVTIGDGGGAVAITMTRVAFSLPSVQTVADRGGLSGVIADSGYRAMPGVQVRVLGTDRDALTDSSGAFFLPLKPGHYMVELKRDGFARQLIGVTVPESEGRKLAAWMIPQTGRSNPLEGANVFELSQRLMRATPVTTQLYTREDMDRLGISDVRQLVSRAAARMLDANCPALINGGPQTLPLWQLLAIDVEFVEVHTARPPTPKTTSVMDAGQVTRSAASPSMTPTSVCGTVPIVWLRK